MALAQRGPDSRAEVGAGGFEPPASGSQSQRSNQAELHPGGLSVPRAGGRYSSMSSRSSAIFSLRSSARSPAFTRASSPRTSEASSTGLNGFVT